MLKKRIRPISVAAAIGVALTLAASAKADVYSYSGWADSGPAGSVYTLLGDANLDIKVNGTDFNRLATNFNQAVTNGWDKGDFNYQGKLNVNDFYLLASHFDQFASQSAVSAADQAALNAFAAANGISANVPEPASVGLLAIGTVGILRRRREQAAK